MQRAVLTILLALLPLPSLAAVTINEVAWMGTANSANDEWIELHNTGSSAVSLDGWQLTDADDLNITIAGAGSLAAGAFAVLERTDDSSAPGDAFYVYTGSLANTGTTLKLHNAAGNLVDQVAGGEDWSNIGGNNESNATAQYTSGGWITAAATPGAANATQPEAAPREETDAENTESSSDGGSVRVATPSESSKPTTPFGLTITAPATAYVAQPVEFSLEMTGRGSRSRTGRFLTWNFGDTHTATGQQVTHQYQYPGSYIVTLRGEYRGEEVLVRHELTVLPVQVAITRNQDGAVQVSNTAKYELTLGNYELTSASDTFTIPPDTILKPNAALTLPPSAFAADAHEVVAVHDQAEQVVAYQLPGSRQAATVSSPPPAETNQPTPSAAANTANYNFASSLTPPEAEASAATTTQTVTTAPATTTNTINALANTSDPAPREYNRLAYFGVIGLLVLVVLALLLRKSKRQIYDE